ncbi:MAG TPA: glycosyltransferase family 4 protein [Candidatus Angelobacter sp.]|nr:glycosyltransferase family 4 protein [Candidatus Angelobacter sp.]
MKTSTHAVGRSSAISSVVHSTGFGEAALASSALQGKRVAMIMFSSYPSDPRPRRAADALLKEGASIDLICLRDEMSARREVLNGINVCRLDIRHRRGGKIGYAYQYSAFILASAALLAIRSLRRRYDLVYVHNMPDVLVSSALIPKALGAKVILDQHDPMPELMTTIFGLEENSIYVRLIKRLEKWSLARVHLVLTVNRACQQIFARRSCPLEKIGVVMNAPDGEIFSLRSPSSYLSSPRRDKAFVIMYHGSLVERNGLDLAIKALVRVRQAIPEVELRIYGKRTPYLERVLQEAENLGLRGAVCYLGPKRLEDLAAEIEGCDVGIVPNRRNAFTDINTPTRIFEYLALGKPVVAPNTPGIQDYFPPGSLFFFEPGNADGLAERIEYVASHPSETTEITERGQQIYLAHTWRRERQTLVTLVSGLFNEKRVA